MNSTSMSTTKQKVDDREENGNNAKRNMANYVGFKADFLLPVWEVSKENALKHFLGHLQSITALRLFETDQTEDR